MPLGKYDCEYCDKQFQDTPYARKRHLQSLQHLRAKAQWYDSFKGTLIYPPSSSATKHLHLYFCVWLVSPFLFDCRSLWCLRTELGKRGLQPLCQNGNCIFFDYPSDFIARWVMGWSQNLIFLWFAQVITHLSIGLDSDFAFIFGLELILAFDYRGFANMGMLANIFIPRTISRIQLLKGYQVKMPKTICLSC